MKGSNPFWIYHFQDFLTIDNIFRIGFISSLYFFDFQPKYPPIMDSRTSSRLPSKIETSQLPMYPVGTPVKTLSKLYLGSLVSILSKLPPDRLVRILSMLYLASPSQVVSKALVIQVGTENARPASSTETIQAMSGTSWLLLLSVEILTMILKFLDIKTLALNISIICKRFYEFFGLCSNGLFHSDGHMGFLYEQLMFSKGGPISQLTPEGNFQRRYFRSNVNFSSWGIEQPKEIRIHVFTTSNSEGTHLNEVSSIVIESPFLKNTPRDAQRTSEFMNNLVKSPLNCLKKLKFIGFPAESWLSEPLSMLKELSWLHWAYSSLDYSAHSFSSLPGLERLHLKFEKGFDLDCFPRCPPSLRELSLHFSDLNNFDSFASVVECRNLEKM